MTSEEGAGLAEYVMLVALIAVTAIIAVSALGEKVVGLFQLHG